MMDCDYKCRASVDGVCMNVFGCGTPCEGYSQRCSLRETYATFDDSANRLQEAMKSAFGIQGDKYKK